MNATEWNLDIANRIETLKIPNLVRRLKPMMAGAGGSEGGEYDGVEVDTTAASIRRDLAQIKDYLLEAVELRTGRPFMPLS
jgi:hypothetical protein